MSMSEGMRGLAEWNMRRQLDRLREQREWERLTRPDCVWNYEPRRDVPDAPASAAP